MTTRVRHNDSIDSPKPAVIRRGDWATDEQLWKGHFEGEDVGTGVTALFFVTDKVGTGLRWHINSYDEIFIVGAGRALFTIAAEKFEADAGGNIPWPRWLAEQVLLHLALAIIDLQPDLFGGTNFDHQPIIDNTVTLSCRTETPTAAALH